VREPIAQISVVDYEYSMPTKFRRPNALADLVMIVTLAAASSVSAWTMGRYFFALAFASAAVVGALKLADAP
jgi:hypothetical protein